MTATLDLSLLPKPSALFTEAMTALSPLVGSKDTYPERVTDDEQGVLTAMAVALKADCTRRKVGCVLVDIYGRVIGTGRNGAPPGMPGCLSAGACPRGLTTYDQVAPLSSYSGAGACIANHAETNGIMFSDPLARRGGTIYITCGPCSDCARMLLGSGLARVVWPEIIEFDDPQWGPMLQWRIASRDIDASLAIDLSSTKSAFAPTTTTPESR